MLVKKILEQNLFSSVFDVFINDRLLTRIKLACFFPDESSHLYPKCKY